jgi:hypothetical protein
LGLSDQSFLNRSILQTPDRSCTLTGALSGRSPRKLLGSLIVSLTWTLAYLGPT